MVKYLPNVAAVIAAGFLYYYDKHLWWLFLLAAVLI